MQKTNNMKIKNLNIKILSFLFVIGLITIMACQKEEEVYPRTRLFQPVLNEDLYSIDNTIIVNLGNMNEAVNYPMKVNRDSFLTKR